MQDFGPIIEPQPIAFSWDAPGWSYLMYTGFTLVLLAIIIISYRYYINAYRRAAIKKIQQENSIASINVILKAIALRSFTRAEVAPLFGAEWIDFLCSRIKRLDMDKSQISRALTSSYEEKESIEDLSLYKSFATLWIRKYHV